MSLEIRCTCGWRCQASEYYLGDRIACPECGTKILVHGSSGIPYGYAPYPTWQKRFPVPAPLTRRTIMLPETDPHAAPAFWLGLLGMFASLTGCGTMIGLVLAVFGIRQALRSARWNRSHSLPARPQARLGMAFSAGAVLLAGVMFFGLFASAGRASCHGPATHVQQHPPQQTQPEQSTQYRYPNNDARVRELRERLKQLDAEWSERERARREQGYRYPAEPLPQLVPSDDFKRDQSDYSKKVKEQRARRDAGYRYE
jgi:hypothetical protein